MSSLDDFIHISMGPNPGPGPSPAPPGPASVAREFYNNSSAQRPFTEGVIVDAIRKKHPNYQLSVCLSYVCDFLAFADSEDNAKYSIHGDPKDVLAEKQFVLPSRRYGDESGGRMAERAVFGCYDYTYNGNDFLLYVVEGQDAMYKTNYSYLLAEEKKLGNKEIALEISNNLIAAASKWLQELHGEVLVFDQGMWQKNKELYDNVQKASWDDVILEKEKKDSLIKDVIGFFDAESRYSEFGVPWKRGVIFYGPPGNGKTISTKALMNDVSKRTSPRIESLYVKSFFSYGGPEYAIRTIFLKARQMAPCLLIFEDIDSLILPTVRSYFLNEVDGLESNHGILMIGSTNHLDRLDPGIAKRPSRFDRKYLFDVPSRDERIQYCEYWRNKLRRNKTIDFPKEMSARVADITDQFSFAYMKEAFVAALLQIVRSGDEIPARYRYWEDDLAGNVFWKALKKQIENLRKEMEGEDEDYNKNSTSELWPGFNALNNVLGEIRTPPMDVKAMPMYQ